MNKTEKSIVVVAVTAFFALCPLVTHAQYNAKKWHSAVNFGMIQHSDHPAEQEIPFGNGDLSYLLAYEYHEGNSFWQLGVALTPHASATSTVGSVESVVSPQLNLIYKRNRFLAGAGVTKHYMKFPDKSLWSDFFWNFQLGICLPISESFELRAAGHYQFRNFSDLGDFNFNAMEWGINLAYSF